MYLRGRINAEIGAGAGDVAPTIDNFYEAYEALVAKEVQGEVHLSFGIYRERKDGTIEYRGYYVIDEAAASKARLRALENAMKESEYARINAERISAFVLEAFDVQ